MSRGERSRVWGLKLHSRIGATGLRGHFSGRERLTGLHGNDSNLYSSSLG